ncbi:hypothetical protein [Blastococcus saxobsidens]|uniref:DinB family protein n=1 Tax=Blastococcus saxobsidens TaxID=138336 RepID=A0A4Q7YAD8_9ACTN|nr:hypothetical protein [Blastococcus saxobsidens]RZU34152.1 hypothetical protein BKA19_3910 [Blastococcus saxobsidens]
MLLNAIDGGAGQQRHEAVGKPIIPSVLVDGDPVPIIHPVQLRGILGMPDESGSAAEPWLPMAWDIAAVLDDWVRLVGHYEWDQLLEPTLSRGRDSRNLTVNVCRPIDLLPAAYREHFFAWYTGEADLQVEAYLHTTEQVRTYVERASRTWQAFLLEVSELPEVDDPFVVSNRGDTAFSELVRLQRFHAAFHHRQICDFLDNAGVPVARLLDVTAFTGIGLPEELY